MQAQVTISIDGDRIVGAWIEYGHDDPNYIPGQGKKAASVTEVYQSLHVLGKKVLEEAFDQQIKINRQNDTTQSNR